jgi:CO/xanthine dehydrogenase FAD-binding subunit
MAHLRFSIHERPAATVSAWVRVEEGRIAAARVAAGSVGIVPVVPADAVAGLIGERAAAIDPDLLRGVGTALADASAPVTDGNGADDYKHALVVELAGRAIREAAPKAAGSGGLTR